MGIYGPSKSVPSKPGAQALSLVSTPLIYHVLLALAEGPCSLIELRRRVGTPPQTTMRLHMKTLIEMGILEQRRQNEFPGTVECELAKSGKDLFKVADALHGWLRQASDGPTSLDSPETGRAVKALVGGWSTNILRALAARPLTLTELNCLISGVSYPTLERRLSAMRKVRLVEPQPTTRKRGTPYRVTSWLRSSLLPLSTAVAWECCAIPALAGPIGRTDVEAALLLAVPTLDLPPGLCGRGRLAVELRGPAGTTFAGVSVQVQDARVTSCVSRLEGEADALVVGTPLGWFRWIKRGEPDSVEIVGDTELAHGLADGFRSSLVEVNPV